MEEADKTGESERGGGGVSAGEAGFREQLILAITPPLIGIWSGITQAEVDSLAKGFGVTRREDALACFIVAAADAIVRRAAK